MLFRLNTDLSKAHIRGGFSTAADMRTYALLNLIWSSFILATPLFEGQEHFPLWLWPTTLSFAVFLWLYFRLFFRDEFESVIGYAIAIAALGFIVVPFNAGAQGYLIYACAFFAFAGTIRDAIRLMAGMLVLFAIEWYFLGFPWQYSLSALVIGPVVGTMNLIYRRNQQRNAELKLSHDEVRRLAALAERERIGRDLHDLLGHTLSLITLKSELANKLFDRDAGAARREIADVERVARDALAQVRRAVTGIRAAGLAAEVASAKLLLESNGVRMQTEIADLELPTEIETAFAMTLREAVTNVQRHAQASSVRVGLRVEEQLLVLRIEDNGRGGAIVPGNGLSGMRERLGCIGADLRVDSERGRGTRLCVSMPVPKDAVIERPQPRTVMEHANEWLVRAPRTVD
jgi:two-component system sensor histidine kinase DesK